MDTSVEHALCVLFTGAGINYERVHSIKVEHLADGSVEARFFNEQDQKISTFKVPPGWLERPAVQEMLRLHDERCR